MPFVLFLFVHAADAVFTRFKSMRTDHIKIWKTIRCCKSGQGVKRLTPLQKFKLDEYKFVQSVYKPRTGSQTLGEVGRSLIDYVSFCGDNYCKSDKSLH